jgi:dTDP-4-amino-4,6-dideoxygalactose transaminase
MVMTDNEEWAEKIKKYGLHGMSRGAWKRFSDSGYKHYQIVYPGYKYNMMDIQAALGIHQLKRVEENLKIREVLWAEYDRLIEGLPLSIPAPPEPDTRHARHLYTIFMDIENTKISRDDVMEGLHQKKIGTGIHYISLHLHPYFQETYGYKRGDFPASEWISDRTLSLPLSPKVTIEDVKYVVDSLKELLADG